MTARYADRVALISSNGRMAETGDPRRLMENEESRLWALINKVRRQRFLKCVFCVCGFCDTEAVGVDVVLVSFVRAGGDIS